RGGARAYPGSVTWAGTTKGGGYPSSWSRELRPRPQLRLRRGPARHNLLTSHHLSEELVDVEQRGVVLGLRVGGTAVAGEQHVVVLHERLSRGRLAAHVGGHARDDDALDAIRAQHQVEVSVLKGAVAVLRADHLVGQRAHLVEALIPFACLAHG